MLVVFLISILTVTRGGKRTAATSKMECFVIIANGWKSLTIITKYSTWHVTTVLDPALVILVIIRLFYF